MNADFQACTMAPEYENIARSCLLLKGAPPAVAESVLGTARLREFDRGATIFLQGERASSIYIVADGWVKLYRISPNGAEAVVGVFTKGSSFGEAVALMNDNYPVAAEAVTDCKVIRIDTDVLLHSIRQSPEIAISILTATFQHLHSLVEQVEQLKARTGAQRVAEFLLDLASCDEGPCEVVLPYDKALIAGRLGLKPESLSRAFAKLRDYGVTIKLNHALIDDIGSLRVLIQEDPANAWART
ncbi:MAG TPA: Crp/Fnr family transcriptional regulator [Aestuariivirga sp.]|nr:Crp/Fnr family transcriptional regulator [Aestuariivirga sp.]